MNNTKINVLNILPEIILDGYYMLTVIGEYENDELKDEQWLDLNIEIVVKEGELKVNFITGYLKNEFTEDMIEIIPTSKQLNQIFKKVKEWYYEN